MADTRIFILSPASCRGLRAKYLLNEQAEFDVACRLRAPQGITLGEAFRFLSGLYFRGKLAYGQAFAKPPAGTPGVLVITPDRGLMRDDVTLSPDDIRRFAEVDVDVREPRYLEPLQRDASTLARNLPASCQVVLLGSIATAKYVNVLQASLGDRLHFPEEFVGRGDMSRGGLLLRCVAEGRELSYVPLAGAVRHGKRPAKLPRAK